LNPSRALVSVIMPVFEPNPAALRLAIDSILRQSHRLLELIVIDDGCSDPLRGTLFSADKRVKLIRHEHNLGRSAARNTGLAAAEGKFIAWADDDDISLPGRLSAQLHHFRKHPEIDFLGTDMVYGDGRPVSPVFREPNQIRFAFMFRNPVNSPTIMFRRRVFDEGLRFDTSLQRAEDYDFYTRASERYIFASMRGVTVKYNYNPNAAGREEEARFANDLRMQLWDKFYAAKDDFAHQELAAIPLALPPGKLNDLATRVETLHTWYQNSGKPFADDFYTVLCTVMAHHIAAQPDAPKLWRQWQWIKYLWNSAWPLRVKAHILRQR
jgi:glycosyltransferase involved in cell wall biosynthesis